jgi:uncharacterized protein YecT (DUF1311 family)
MGRAGVQMAVKMALAAAAVVGGAPAAAQTQAEMNAIAMQGLKAADSELNAAYKTLMARLAAADRTRLRTAQRAWITARDTTCQFVSGGADGGSMAPQVAATSAQHETEARTRMLVKFNDCPEGQAACPL